MSDKRTMELMVDFYTYLVRDGKTKDEALRLSKLDFLERHAGEGDATHPFFWAAFIGIGDMRAVK